MASVATLASHSAIGSFKLEVGQSVTVVPLSSTVVAGHYSTVGLPPLKYNRSLFMYAAGVTNPIPTLEAYY